MKSKYLINFFNHLNIFFIAFLFLSQNLFSLTYKVNKNPTYPFMDILEITEKLKKFSFNEMDLSKAGSIFGNSFDQIYFKVSNPNLMAILKLDISLDQEIKKLTLSKTEFVCHGQLTQLGQTGRKRHFALYFKGISFNEFSHICSQIIKKETIFSFKKYLMNNFLNKAIASSSADCRSQKSIFRNFSEISNVISESIFIQKLGTCAIDALRSALKNYKSVVDNALEISLNPIDYWQEVSQQAEQLKDFVIHLSEEMKQLYSVINKMDSDLLLTLGCHVAGELISSASLSALGGFSALKLSENLIKIFSMLKKNKTLISSLTILSKIGQSKVTQEILSCVYK